MLEDLSDVLESVALNNEGQPESSITIKDKFLAKNGDKKCVVWTGEENIPALHLYESFGFLQNGLESTVYMKG